MKVGWYPWSSLESFECLMFTCRLGLVAQDDVRCHMRVRLDLSLRCVRYHSGKSNACRHSLPSPVPLMQQKEPTALVGPGFTINHHM